MSEHVCSPKADKVTLCSCGQYWINGRAVASFVGRTAYEDQQARDAAIKAEKAAAKAAVAAQMKEHGYTKGPHYDDLIRGEAFRKWATEMKKKQFTARSVRALYWEHPDGKSYVSIGNDVSWHAPKVSYQSDDMWCFDRDLNTVFKPSKALTTQTANLGSVKQKRKAHGYKLVYEVVV